MLSSLSRARRVLLVDSGVALAFAAFAAFSATQPWDDGYRAGPLALDLPLVVLAVLPLALRRTRPAVALGLMILAGFVPSLFVAVDHLFWAGYVPLLLLLFTVARAEGGAVGRLTWCVLPVLSLVSSAREPELRSANELWFAALTSGAVWVAGRVMRRLDLDQQRLAEAVADLDQRREEREEAARDEERSRIAGEMHDVVSHAVSLMVLQVGAARFELESAAEPSPASGQLRSAELAGRDALDQLRRSLAVLRSPA